MIVPCKYAKVIPLPLYCVLLQSIFFRNNYEIYDDSLASSIKIVILFHQFIEIMLNYLSRSLTFIEVSVF